MIPLVGRRPIYLALGNHDDRANFLDVFESPAGPNAPVKGKHIVTVDAGPARFILLDSLVTTNRDGRAAGQGPADLARNATCKPATTSR